MRGPPRDCYSQQTVNVAQLEFRREEQVLLRLKLERAEVSPGSNPTNDVVVPDPAVPDLVAVLQDMGAQRYRLQPVNDGLLINGQALSEAQVLEPGDVITVGSYQLTFTVEVDTQMQRAGRTSVMTAHEDENGRALLEYGGRTFSLGNTPFNIGGHTDNDLTIKDAFISSFHCRVARQEGRWFITDLDSTNGTEVNGLKVHRAELPEEAEISLGKARLQFKTQEGSGDFPAAIHCTSIQKRTKRRK